jgi:threonine dehydrogenase-like Zn-dependent dehydrogenase
MVNALFFEICITVEPNRRAPGSMLALRWYGEKDVRVEETGIPTITGPTDVICQITGTTVCSSDLHLYHKEILQLQKGDILGHEWMYIVIEVGGDVKTLKGDRVVSSFQIAYIVSISDNCRPVSNSPYR